MRYARLRPLDRDTAPVQAATVAVVGAGATGSRMLEQLARLGADIRVVDRDYLEESNLATSALYTEEQVAERLPKAVAAQERLRAINSGIAVEAAVDDVNHRTVHGLLDGADLVMDGTDNITTRHLLNEYCLDHGVPWVHVSALGERGEAMPVVPGAPADAGDRRSRSDLPPGSPGVCFNCVFGEVDGALLETCETAGISPAAAATAASLGVTTAVGILAGEYDPGLTRFDLGTGRFQHLGIERSGCSVCNEGERPYLDGENGAQATTVCGEHQYQVQPSTGGVDLDALENQLQELGSVTRNRHLLRFTGNEQFTVFRDGRMIVDAESREDAKSIYSRFVGR